MKTFFNYTVILACLIVCVALAYHTGYKAGHRQGMIDENQWSIDIQKAIWPNEKPITSGVRPTN